MGGAKGVPEEDQGGRSKIKIRIKIKKKIKSKRKRKIKTGGRRACPPEYVWAWHPRGRGWGSG